MCVDNVCAWCLYVCVCVWWGGGGGRTCACLHTYCCYTHIQPHTHKYMHTHTHTHLYQTFWLCMHTYTDAHNHWPIHRPHAVADLNQRREKLLFLVRIFVPHAGITNNGSAHTGSVRFCRFWFNSPNTSKWLYGCLQGNRLRTISSSNLYGHHWQNLGFVLSSFSSSVTLLSFFLSFSVSPWQIHGVSVRFSWDDPCLHNNNK